MTANAIVRTASALFAAGLVLATAAEAHATCGDPPRLELDNKNFNSWPWVGGGWTRLASAGMSDSHCYAKDDHPVGQPQVIFEYSGSWYAAIASDCSAPIHNMKLGDVVTSGNPTNLDFVHSVRMLTLEITADDYYAAYLDDASTAAGLIGMDDHSHDHSNVHTTLVRSGAHSMIVDSKDIYSSVAGMAASIELEGCTDLLLTGQDDWLFDTTPFVWPGATGSAYDVSDEFGNPPGGLLADGADYIWWSPDATDLGRAVFTLDFFVD